MTYLLDREFPFGLENLLLCGKNIEEKGLQIIAQIEAKHIVHGSDELKKLFEIIYVFLTIFLYLLKCPQSLIL